MWIERRALLGSLGAAGLLGSLKAKAHSLDVSPFQLGVASGDPEPDGFVIWTRLAPDPLAPHGGMSMKPVSVSWEVAADENFRTVVQKGEAVARPELAHSVHVEVQGLAPGRPYWYRFSALGSRSYVGRAATTPAPGSAVQQVRFAIAGCQHFEEGYFHAFRQISREQLDFVFHYGDYIYEYPAAQPLRILNGMPFTPVRRVVGAETYSLDDYRQRYAQYKMDPDLQAAHASAPWFVTFDDHEVENNWASSIDENGTPPKVFALRRAAAFQAWYEHMPVRRSAFPVCGALQAHRGASWGNLLSAFFLDTRQYRSDQACGDGGKALCSDARDETRTMLGAAQEQWLFAGLAQSRTRWNVLAQQVLMMDLDFNSNSTASERLAAMDTWGGYPAARERLLRHIQAQRLANVVVLTGDAHQHFAGDVLLRPESKPVASEFLTTSATSGGDGQGERPTGKEMLRRNPELKFLLDKRGYSICTVRHDSWTTDMMAFDAVTRPDAKQFRAARFVVEHGRPGIQRA